MGFSQLAHHATWMMPTDRERIRRFVDGLNYSLCILMTRERVLGVSFEGVADIARDIETVRRREREEREAKRPRGSSSFSGAPSRGQFQRGRGHSFRPPQPTRPEYSRTYSNRGHQGFQQGQTLLNALPAQSSSYAPSVQGSSTPSASAGHSGVRGSLQFPSPVPGSCYKCREFGHIKRQCPRLCDGQFQQRGQPLSSAPVSSAPAQSLGVEDRAPDSVNKMGNQSLSNNREKDTAAPYVSTPPNSTWVEGKDKARARGSKQLNVTTQRSSLAFSRFMCLQGLGNLI
uniref:Uncharacterized protein LOC104222512 n=1 Tax=Nicotiana sylvestris TaxID=4096 RepID=A0A1U7WBL0_NICSY|nr:PREDICTED: uncharacterized protein LOC104222512 [Nicotiana sylvestris]